VVFEFFGFETEFGVVVEECDYVGFGCPRRKFNVGFVGGQEWLCPNVALCVL